MKVKFLGAAMSAALTIGLLAAPAAGASVVEGRAQAVGLLKSGGPVLSAAAEQALLGSDEDLRVFLADGRRTAKAEDDRVLAVQDEKNRKLIVQAAGRGGPSVKDAAKKALAGTAADRKKFLEIDYAVCQNIDYDVLTTRQLSAGPEVRAAAQRALNTNNTDDVRDFVFFVRQAATDRDNESAEVQRLTDEAYAAADQGDKEGARYAAGEAAAVAKNARDANAQRLDGLRFQWGAEARAAWQAEIDRAKRDKAEADKAAAQKADAAKLIADAAADATLAVPNGRRAAATFFKLGGPAVKAAAEVTLSGDEADARAFVATELAVATEKDDRAAVAAIANGPGSDRLHQAARDVLAGPYTGVVEFLRTRDYPGRVTDDRIAVNQIMSAGGRVVKERAQKALDGTPADVRAFLEVGQFAAKIVDDRIKVAQSLSSGAEVNAAAQAVLDGSDSALAPFLASGLGKAKLRDQDTAAHVARIEELVAGATAAAESVEQ